MFEISILFLSGVILSFLSNISGGGGALIELPLLMAMGLSPATAIGTFKLGSLGVMLGSLTNKKHQAQVRRDVLIPLLAIVFCSSIIGPFLSLNLADSKVKIISAIIIIITGPVSLLSLRIPAKAREVKKWQRNLGYFSYFISTTILAGFGSGIGLINTYIIVSLIGLSPLEAISTRRFLGIFGLPIQLIPFILQGRVNYVWSAALFAGMLIGGYLGMSFAIKKGNEFVKRAMAIVAIILVISLFV